MASCPKCGKHIKRRKRIAKCRHCGPLVTLNGKLPENPFGSCFDAAAYNLLGNINNDIENMVMCHGIGIANYPGIEGKKISHAWVEFDHPQGRCAVDPIWLIAQPAETYRKNLKTELVIEYPPEEFMKLWAKHDFPGPWDERIANLTNEKAA